MSLYDRLARVRAESTDEDRPAPQENGPVPFADLRRKVHAALVESLGPKLYSGSMKADQLESRVRTKLTQSLEEEGESISAAQRQRLVKEIADDILGYGPIEPFLSDPTVTEIMVNGPDAIYVERQGKVVATNVRFVDDAHLRRTIDKIVGQVGRRIDDSQPYVDARLPDGSRVNAVIPPVTLDGPVLTIRRFSAVPYTAMDLVELGTFTNPLHRFLEACVRGKINILVSGGTSVGKTSTLNVLSSFIPHDERIVTIEDAAELRLQQPHVVRMEFRPPNIEGRGEVTIRDLVRNALRMRPDRIVVGEVRGGEALDMLQAMNTGHDGSISTIHANTPRDALARLETMTLMAGYDLPVRAIRQQMASAINLVVQQARLGDGRRRITAVSEVTGMESDVITMQDLFLFDYGMGRDSSGLFKGHLKATGIRPKFADHLEDLGILIDPDMFEPERMVRNGSKR